MPGKIKLEKPAFQERNLEGLLQGRFSCRSFKDKALTLEQISNILWATCGVKFDSVTGATRTAPSAGATNPLELYIVVGRNSIDTLKDGVYHYLIEEHGLEIIARGDKRDSLADACLGQDFISQAPVSLVIAAKLERTTKRYGPRGERYVYIETGHASQNTYLAVTNLNLGTVEVGAFVDENVLQVLGLEKDCIPLIVMPIGYPKRLKWAE